jgi:hypothetical protein
VIGAAAAHVREEREDGRHQTHFPRRGHGLETATKTLMYGCDICAAGKKLCGCSVLVCHVACVLR